MRLKSRRCQTGACQAYADPGEGELGDYQLLRRFIQVKPYPTLEGFRTIFADLAKRVPAARNADPKGLMQQTDVSSMSWTARGLSTNCIASDGNDFLVCKGETMLRLKRFSVWFIGGIFAGMARRKVPKCVLL